MVVIPPRPVQWTVKPEWKGETAYIVAGGTSVKQQNLGLLRGRRVVAINSSYLTYPAADILFFGDGRWYNEHKNKPQFNSFAGKIVTCSGAARGPRLVGLFRINPPPGYAPQPTHVVSKLTNLQGAMNMLGHLGVICIVLLGVDMGRGADGSTHHHEPHKWPNGSGNSTWDDQMKELSLIVQPLRERNIQVINTSPISRIDWWPKMSLEQAIEGK